MPEKNLLFETINAIFTDKQYISNLTPEFINQNIFMINRRMAIQYPMQASVFNINKINNIELLKVWSDFLYTGKTVPAWIYTKSSNKVNKKSSDTISNTTLKKYIQYYNINKKDITAALRFDHDNAISELKNFEKIIKEQENANIYNKRNTK